jgi:hypothetical protein
VIRRIADESLDLSCTFQLFITTRVSALVFWRHPAHANAVDYVRLGWPSGAAYGVICAIGVHRICDTLAEAEGELAAIQVVRALS